MNWGHHLEQLVTASIFGVVGILIFMGALWLVHRACPFSISKEIAEDQNVALAIVMAAGILGLAAILCVAMV